PRALAVACLVIVLLALTAYSVGVRAIVVDACPPSQQSAAAAFSMRWNVLGSAVLSTAGFVSTITTTTTTTNTTTTQPSETDPVTAFRTLAYVAAICSGATVGLVCWLVPRDATLPLRQSRSGPGSASGIGRVCAMCLPGELARRWGRLPPLTGTVCGVQLVAYAYETALSEFLQTPSLELSSSSEAKAKPYALYASLSFSLGTLLSTLVLTFLSHISTVLQPRNLPRLWLLSQLLATTSLLLTIPFQTSTASLILLSLIGATQAVTMWVPFALINTELAEVRTGVAGVQGLHNLAISLPQVASALCVRCVGVTVEALVRLAEIEFQADEFPKKAFYRHHESFPLLEKAADAGCELCRLILECFIHTPCDEEEPVNWPGRWDEDLARNRAGQQRTMYTLAERLLASDVKLSINASHLYSFEPLDAVEVFDEILVQVGPSYTEDDEGYGIWGFRIGRYEVDPDLSSSKNHELARRWLSDCRNNHESCVSDRKHELPTRVIDVEAGSPSHVRLVLTRGVRDAYAALSHCWGGAISPSLTTETLGPFQNSIPVGSLPPNFRDAITITRQLGLRFLWIDCLCIQQDSRSDWEAESKKMGLVYRNSTVTISAMVSTGSKAGILKKDQGVIPVNRESITIGMSNTNGSSRISIRRKDPEEENLRRLDTESALQTRGWTLQEYILSPRHILYGKSMVYWRCPQRFISPDGLSFGNKSPDTVYKELTNVIYSDVLSPPKTTPCDTKVVLDDYYDLVSAYSWRRLTYASDKLPAFSGLAQRLHPVVGGDYLAGIWSADFRRGLLWTPEMKFCRHSNAEYRAPSWSWAVTDDRVLFEQSVTLGPSPSSAQLLDYTVQPRVPDNPYGEILALKLVLEVLTKPLVRSRQIIGTILDRASIGSAAFDEPAGDEDLTRMGSPELFRVQEQDRDYVVSVISRPGDEVDWELNLALYREDEYTLVLVHTDDSSEDEPGCNTPPALQRATMGDTYDPVQQAFKTAIQDFKSNLKNEELYRKILETTSIDQVYDATDSLQKEQAKTGHLRHLSKIDVYLRRLREYAGVVEVFVQAKPDILALIWGPIKLILQWANVLKQSFDAIVNVLGEIGDMLPEFTEMSSLFEDNDRVKEVLVLFFKDILDFYLITLQFFRLKFVFEMLWPSRREKINMVGDLIKRHTLLMRNEVRLEEIREAHNARRRDLEHFQMTERASTRQEYASIRVHVSPRSYDEDLYRLSESICPGTGKWLFRDNTFREWIDPAASVSKILWLKGIPGSGKTYLASTIVNRARSLESKALEHIATEHIATLFAFLSYKEFHTTALSVIHSLIFQLTDDSETLQAALCQSSRQNMMSSLEVAVGLLESLLRCAGFTFIVVDGIDEIEDMERARLLRQLLRLIKSCEGCRILLSSRPESDLAFILRDHTVDIEVNKRNSGSIQVFVNNRMAEWFRVKAFDPDFQQGMFLYARVVFAIIWEIDGLEELRSLLKFPPTTLNDAYGRIFDKVNQSADVLLKSKARRILGWVCCAPSPLTRREIEHALIVNSEDTEGKARVISLLDVVRVCGPIVEVVDDYVQFVHFTAKDVELTGEEIDKNILSGAYRLYDFATLFWFKILKQFLILNKREKLPDDLVDGLERLYDERYDAGNQANAESQDTKVEFDIFGPKLASLQQMLKHVSGFQKTAANADYRLGQGMEQSSEFHNI
ncbi:hypothetical protein CTA2_230, partial [Colletotrichum tanaceti]